jgi:hypothetical protein
MTPVATAPHTFTWRWLPAVTLGALVLRLWWAHHTLNIYHPDEVFQYLEQAHRWVFGYGFIPWEFRFGTRSWLLPLLLSAPLAALKGFGWDTPAIYVPVVQSLLAVCATSVVPMGYYLTRRRASEDAARMAAVLLASWYELLHFSVRPLPDSMAVIIVTAMFVAAFSRRSTAATAGGICAALLLVLRVHLLPLTAIAAFVATRRWSRRQGVIGACAWTFTVLLLGALDAWMWGDWFASVYNNVHMNFVLGVSALFGVEHPLFLVGALGATSAGLWWLVPLASTRELHLTALPLLIVTVIVASLSLVGHKEYRFILPAVPVLLILLATCATAATAGWNGRRRAVARGTVLAAMATLSWAGATARLPYEWRVYEAPLASDDVLRAVRVLREDPGLVALYVPDPEWALTGGYYHLHRDVPVYFGDEAAPWPTAGVPQEYASHVLDWTHTDTPGFETIARFGDVEIRRNVTGIPLREVTGFSRHLPQPGIDGVFVPTVRPRFPD